MRAPVAVKHRGLKFFIIVVGILLVAVARLAREKGGNGRTSVFMAFYDMLRNPQISEKDIVYRQCLIGGTCAYFEYYPGVKEWRVPLFVETGYMIHVMKMYADQNVGNGYSKSWSQWKKETFGK